MSTETNPPLDKPGASKELAVALRDGSSLLQTDTESSKQTHQTHHDLKSVLESRLSQYYTSRNQDWSSDSLGSLADAELLTARESLSVVERIQQLLAIEDDAVVPTIGTRDLSQIRTLLSLVFKWGTDPLLNKVREAWPSKTSPSTAGPSTSRIVDLSTLSDDYILLSQLTVRILGLIFPNGVHGKLPQSFVTTTVLNRHLVDVLRPAFALGWLPRSMSTEQAPVVDAIRPLVVRLLSILPTSQTISSLGNIVSDSPPPPAHVYKACTTLLSRQVLRPDGVLGLFAAVFGEEETMGGDITVEKLEHVSTVLNAVPANTKPQDYFEHVIPRIIALLSDKSPPTYRRAAAFTVSRVLSTDSAPLLRSVKRGIVHGLLHEPLVRVYDEVEGHDLQSLERFPPATKIHLRPDAIIDALLKLLSNADPSPSFTSDLLSPIIAPLYSLLYHMNNVKTSDPKLKESLRGMLLTWGKIVTANEGIEVLWSIIRDGQQGGWKIDLEGHIQLLPEPERLSSLSLLTPDQVPKAVNLENPDFDTNVFNLYPDPFYFVKQLKDMDRGDISSDLFVRLLETYRGERLHSSGDSLRILLYLQIIMQMQEQLSEGATSNILKKPQQMLTFIHHVLESADSPPSLEVPDTEQSKLGKLKFVLTTPEVEDVEGDSDDDMPDSEVVRSDDELTETAINLLLSVLEADEDLSARTMPILNDIFSLLEPLSKDGSSTIRPLAREARLVMTARLASTSQHSKQRNKNKMDEEESAQEIYQKALKLLQDPILPVRAHGLLLLRQLVTSSKDNKGRGVRALDPALTPAILSIFLQSIQDEDSYIFLNSVQGLAAMADGLGREVLKGLVNEYAGKLEGLGVSVVTQQEVDVRTRVGEALGIVIKRRGDTLGIYADVLVPPLFKLVRTREIPTTLRTSAVSLLGECVNTYPLAVLSYTEDLAGAMVDLLQTESVPNKPRTAKDKDKKAVDGLEEEDTEKQPETMDNVPTSINAKLPPLRRAALHFLGLLVKEATRYTYESPSTNVFLSQGLISKALVTLEYVASTDEDNVVRVMAREVKQALGGLQKARFGL